MPFVPSKASTFPTATLTHKPHTAKALQAQLQQLDPNGLEADGLGLSESQVEGDQGLATSKSDDDENDQIDDDDLSMSLQAFAPRST